MNTPYWFSNLTYWSAQVALLVLAAGFLPYIFKIRQPRVLLIYWRALIVVSLLLPFAQPWHRPEPVATINFAPRIGEFTPIVIATSAPVAHWHLPSPQMIAGIISLIILAGIAARFTILALGLMKLRQFRRASSPISNQAESSALLNEMRVRVNTGGEFRLSSHIASPVTFGFTAPIILLPERFPTLDAQYQSAIACHELLHVRRRDWAHHLSEEILRAALWFHPAIAWLIARIRLSREQVVDLEVVKLTDARKPYLEALLEFTNSRALATAIPAPPFLVERQLAERVALMLKEVRMSRTRLIASLTATAACLALVATIAVWTFPLKAAPRPQQNPPQAGVVQGVTSGVVGGVTRGVINGVVGGVVGGVTKGVSGGITQRVDGVTQGVHGGVTNGIPGGVSANTRIEGVPAGIIGGITNGVPASQPQPAPKIVVTDIKFEGEFHDADAARARVLKGINGREWDGSNKEWLDVIAEVGVRGDFQNHGYFEASVEAEKFQVVESTPTQQRVVATFNVIEGDRFTTGDVTFVNAYPETPLAVSLSELRQQIQLAKGDWLSVDELRKGITRMVQLFVAHGFKNTTIVPSFLFDRTNHVVEVEFTVHQESASPSAKLQNSPDNLNGQQSNGNLLIIPATKTPDANPNDQHIIGKFQLLPPADASSSKFQTIPPATPSSGTFERVAPAAPGNLFTSPSPMKIHSSNQAFTAGQNGVTMPKCIYCPAPKYSDEALAAKLTGTVRLQVTVLANGHPSGVKLLEGIGGGLDEKAIETVRDQWTFTPAKSPDGVAVDVTVPIEVIFQIAPDKKAPNASSVSAPVCEYCPRPEYTSQAKKARVSGTVRLQVTVLANGRAGEIKVTNGLGMGLDDKAIEIVKKKWKFKPAVGPNGNPVISVIPIEISFQLY